MNYILMHKRKKTARVSLDETGGYIREIYDVYAPEHIPVGAAGTDGTPDRAGLSRWWHRRAIPASRAGLREAFAIMDIDSPEYLLEKCWGLSLSDQYWLCPEGSGLTWDDVNFFEHDFSEDVGNILLGGASPSKNISLMSPDNSSGGWLRKKWSLSQGKRVLLKGGSGVYRQEPYNEVIASRIMERLNVPHAAYSLLRQGEAVYSVCEDFITPETELITAADLLRNEKRPHHVLEAEFFIRICEELGLENTRLFLDQMLTVDFIIANEDRHMNNFGAVRNAETLTYIGMAPVYDSGTSLWLSTRTDKIRPLSPKLPSKPFKPTHHEQLKLVNSFAWLELKKLEGIEEECAAVLDGSEYIDEERKQAICGGIRERIGLLAEIADRA